MDNNQTALRHNVFDSRPGDADASQETFAELQPVEASHPSLLQPTTFEAHPGLRTGAGEAEALCQEDARASCCTRDEGGPFGAVL